MFEWDMLKCILNKIWIPVRVSSIVLTDIFYKQGEMSSYYWKKENKKHLRKQKICMSIVCKAQLVITIWPIVSRWKKWEFEGSGAKIRNSRCWELFYFCLYPAVKPILQPYHNTEHISSKYFSVERLLLIYTSPNIYSLNTQVDQL